VVLHALDIMMNHLLFTEESEELSGSCAVGRFCGPVFAAVK
jgi:hypothetical protein